MADVADPGKSVVLQALSVSLPKAVRAAGRLISSLHLLSLFTCCRPAGIAILDAFSVYSVSGEVQTVHGGRFYKSSVLLSEMGVFWVMLGMFLPTLSKTA